MLALSKMFFLKSKMPAFSLIVSQAAQAKNHCGLTNTVFVWNQ